MTYSWAILAVVIVGVVLWQMGLFDLGGKQSPGYTGFSILVPLDWQMTYVGASSECSLSVQLSNAAGEAIHDITIEGSPCTPNNLSAGRATICTKDLAMGTGSTCNEPGRSYKEGVIITYTRTATGESFQSAGVLWGSVS